MERLGNSIWIALIIETFIFLISCNNGWLMIFTHLPGTIFLTQTGLSETEWGTPFEYGVMATLNLLILFILIYFIASLFPKKKSGV